MQYVDTRGHHAQPRIQALQRQRIERCLRADGKVTFPTSNAFEANANPREVIPYRSHMRATRAGLYSQCCRIEAPRHIMKKGEHMEETLERLSLKSGRRKWRETGGSAK
jgi:hypothetical protein